MIRRLARLRGLRAPELLMLAAILVCLPGFMCSRPTPPPPPPKSPVEAPLVNVPAPTAHAATDTPAADRLHELQDLLSATQGRVLDLKHEVDKQTEIVAREHRAATLAPVRTTMLWCLWLGGIIAVAGIGLAVASTMLGWGLGGKCLALAGGGTAVSAASLGAIYALDAAVEHPWWILGTVLGLVVVGAGGIAIAILHGRKLTSGRDESVRFGQHAIDELQRVAPERAQAVRAAAVVRQVSEKTRDEVRRVRGLLGLRKPDVTSSSGGSLPRVT